MTAAPSRSLPIAINARSTFKPDLRAIVRAADADPMGLTCAVRLAETTDACATVRIGHGELTPIVIPVVGSWPLGDLSPRGIQRLMRRILAEAVIDADCHQDALAHHAAMAVAMCEAKGTLPAWAADTTNPIDLVEICLDDDQTPAFWVTDPDGDPVRLAVDLATLMAVAGPMLLPCHTYELGEETWIGFSASDSEGIDVAVEPLDPIETLRLHKSLADMTRSACRNAQPGKAHAA